MGISHEFAAYLQPDLSDSPCAMTIMDGQQHVLKVSQSLLVTGDE
jgi:hypothetical protein